MIDSLPTLSSFLSSTALGALVAPGNVSVAPTGSGDAPTSAAPGVATPTFGQTLDQFLETRDMSVDRALTSPGPDSGQKPAEDGKDLPAASDEDASIDPSAMIDTAAMSAWFPGLVMPTPAPPLAPAEDVPALAIARTAQPPVQPLPVAADTLPKAATNEIVADVANVPAGDTIDASVPSGMRADASTPTQAPSPNVAFLARADSQATSSAPVSNATVPTAPVPAAPVSNATVSAAPVALAPSRTSMTPPGRTIANPDPRAATDRVASSEPMRTRTRADASVSTQALAQSTALPAAPYPEAEPDAILAAAIPTAAIPTAAIPIATVPRASSRPTVTPPGQTVPDADAAPATDPVDARVPLRSRTDASVPMQAFAQDIASLAAPNPQATAPEATAPEATAPVAISPAIPSAITAAISTATVVLAPAQPTVTPPGLTISDADPTPARPAQPRTQPVALAPRPSGNQPVAPRSAVAALVSLQAVASSAPVTIGSAGDRTVSLPSAPLSNSDQAARASQPPPPPLPATPVVANARQDNTIAVSTTPQPAGQVFAAAIATATSWRDRAVRNPANDALDATTAVAASPIALQDRGVVQAAADAQGSALDLTQDTGLQRMIDRIETLRDNSDAGSTRIRLIPDALGSVDIAVRQDGDRVHVSFTAEQDATRVLLTDAQPRLTELAAARGVRIGESSVGGGATGSGMGSGSMGSGNMAGGNMGGTNNAPPQPRPQLAPAPRAVADDSLSTDDQRVA